MESNETPIRSSNQEEGLEAKCYECDKLKHEDIENERQWKLCIDCLNQACSECIPIQYASEVVTPKEAFKCRLCL